MLQNRRQTNPYQNECRVCKRGAGGGKYEKNNTHSRRIPNRKDTHQKNKVHVLGSHILSLKIVTKTPNHILMLFAYGFFPLSLHLLRMCFLLIQTVCVSQCMFIHIYFPLSGDGVWYYWWRWWCSEGWWICQSNSVICVTAPGLNYCQHSSN